MIWNELIKEKRKEMGLTMREVAKGVGVSVSTVSKWESGEIKNLRVRSIGPLARVLRIDPTQLI